MIRGRDGATRTPLVVDLGPRKIRYAGDVGDLWFASHVHEPLVLGFDAAGAVRERLPCPPVDRVLDVDGVLVGLESEYAWGRRWGHAFSGERSHTAAYDARTGRALWRTDGDMAALVGPRLALTRDRPRRDHPFACRDVLTGEPRWTIDDDEPAIATDGDQIFVLDHLGRIRALDLATGEERWRLEPPDDRRVQGYLCRVLAPAPEGIWYAAHPADEQAVLICLARGDGSVVAEHPFDGWVNDLRPVDDGVLVVHELGIAHLSGGRVAPRVDELADARCRACGRSFAAYAEQGRKLVHAGARTAERRVRLADEWKLIHAAADVAVLASDTRVLRWPLGHQPDKRTGPVRADVVRPQLDDTPLEPATVIFGGPAMVLVEHATRGRFTLKAPDTGLAKGDRVELGGFVAGPMNSTTATVLAYRDRAGARRRVEVSPPPGASAGPIAVGTVARAPKGSLPSGVANLLASLAELGLVDPMPVDQARKLARRVFPDDDVGETAVAYVLQHVHGETGGLDRGFLSHDWRFGQETNDVIAEFARCLPGEPVAFAQVAMRPNALLIRATGPAGTTEEWVDVSDGGLHAVAAHLDRALAQAGARRRIVALETDGDWDAFLIRPPEDLARLRPYGITGLD